ncbi:hypothetical protein DFJ74DRAFT_707604 [Hyaloraphidium curvatum]|nr:hypothetical protein DFJ74DRAFT_707604 [Hyaloraphidium curvatum]
MDSQQFADLRVASVGPIKRVSFLHGGEFRRNEGTEFDPRAVLDGDAIYVKYAFARDTMIGRAIFGENAQGPPGSCHGGSVFALLDDMIGVCGMLYAIQVTLEASVDPNDIKPWKTNEEAVFETGRSHDFLSMALAEHDRDPGRLKLNGFVVSEEELAAFRARGASKPPYTPRESAFIMASLGHRIRQFRGVPSNLVGNLSGKLRRRTPLLTPLLVVAKAVERKGRRVKIRAQVLSTGGRTTAWDPEDQPGGAFNTVQAEAEGETVVISGEPDDARLEPLGLEAPLQMSASNSSDGPLQTSRLLVRVLPGRFWFPVPIGPGSRVRDLVNLYDAVGDALQLRSRLYWCLELRVCCGPGPMPAEEDVEERATTGPHLPRGRIPIPDGKDLVDGAHLVGIFNLSYISFWESSDVFSLTGWRELLYGVSPEPPAGLAIDYAPSSHGQRPPKNVVDTEERSDAEDSDALLVGGKPAGAVRGSSALTLRGSPADFLWWPFGVGKVKPE